MLDCIITVNGYWDLYPEYAPRTVTLNDGIQFKRQQRSSHRPDRTKTGPVREFLALRGSYFKAVRDHLKECRECQSHAGEIAHQYLDRIIRKVNNPARNQARHPGVITFTQVRWLYQQFPANPQVIATWMVTKNLVERLAGPEILAIFEKSALR